MIGSHRNRRTAISLGLAAALAAATGVQAAPLFAPENAAAPSVSAPQSKRLANLRKERGKTLVRMVKINVDALQDSTLEFGLEGNSMRRAKRDRIERHKDGGYSWCGKLEGVDGEAVISVNGDEIEGTIQDGTKLYQIRQIGPGNHALIEVDQSQFPESGTPVANQDDIARIRTQIDNALMAIGTSQMGSDTSIVRVAVAYTARVDSLLGGATAVANRINQAVSLTNQSYRNSQVKARLQLAGRVRMTYRETGKTYSQMLSDFRGTTDGNLDNIHTLRNSWSADISVLLADMGGTGACGVAYVMASATSAFAVVDYNCATSVYTFAHEIGHLYGALHNIEDSPALTPFAYGHGFRQPTWRTVMSYNCSPSCPRINYWSNPRVTYGGVAMGTVDRQDNARVLNTTAPILASFRVSVPGMWRYTGTPCTGGSCPGWQMMDNNPNIVAMAASTSYTYQLRNNGAIYRYTGVPCSGSSCTGWTLLNSTSTNVAIAADGTNLYRILRNGEIWRYNGSSWQMLDNNPNGKAIAASGGNLYQLHQTGAIWRFTGTVCSGSSCPGWTLIHSGTGNKAIAADGARLYRIENSGLVARYSAGAWTTLSTATNNRDIVAGGGYLYELKSNGQIWRHNGSGWTMLDNNPATVALTAGSGTSLYQLHADGKVWRFTGTVCSGSSCPGWQMLDNNLNTTGIEAAGSALFQLHGN